MYSKSGIFWKGFYLLPVLLVYFIIGINMYTYTIYYCFDFPLKISFSKTILSIIFYLCAFMTIITHTLCMLTHPGWVDQEKLKFYKEKYKMKELSYCKKCEVNRPFKAHHCSTCQNCILKMDHHCPWIANCVGFQNQKFFYQFLFWASLGDFAGAIGLLLKLLDPSFMKLMKPNTKININENIFFEIVRVLKDPLLIILGFGLCLSMAIAIGFLFWYQTYLILNDSSSIDDKGERHGHNCNDKDNLNQEVCNNIDPKNIQKCEKNVSEKNNKSEDNNKIKNCDGIFTKFKKTFSKEKVINLKAVLGMESYTEWFLPFFTESDINNGYGYSNPDP